jgi:hypothetical protein
MEEKDIKTEVIHIDDSIESQIAEPDLPAPEEGSVWRRKYDGLIFYGGVYLGKRFVSYTGKELKAPVEEIEDDYELIDSLNIK